MLGGCRAQNLGVSMGRRAIFLDRDGVLNENRADYVRSWDEFVFLPGTFTALRRLANVESMIVVITNQAGVGRNLISSARIDEIHQKMVEEIGRHGVQIQHVFLCPHTVSDRCTCRKPEPGMLLRASERLDIDLTQSVFIGDALTDIEAGRRAGCRTVLVKSGRGQEAVSSIDWNDRRTAVPDAVADDLNAAVPIVRQMLKPAPSRGPRWQQLRTLQPSVVSDGLIASSLQAIEG